MAFEVGALQASLKIRLDDFMSGLRTAVTATQRTTQELSKPATLRVDARGLQQGLTAAAKTTDAAWTALLGRLRDGTRDVDQLGERAHRAGEQGASGFLHFGREVVGAAKGFALAQLGISSVEQALEGLKRFFEGVTEAVGAQEQEALHFARAVARSSGDQAQDVDALIARYRELENVLEEQARSIGAHADTAKKAFNLATDAGIQEQAALEGVKAVMLALRNLPGAERQVRTLNEAMAVFTGNIDQADRLVQQWGRDAVVAFSDALRANDVAKATEIAAAKIKLLRNETQRQQQSVEGVRQAYAQAWEEVKKTAAGQRFAATQKAILGEITTELQKHGPLWETTTKLINTGTLALQGFKGALDGLAAGYNWVTNLGPKLIPDTDALAAFQRTLAAAGKTAAEIAELTAAWQARKGQEATLPPRPTGPTGTTGGGPPTPSPEQFKTATELLERHKALNDALLQTEQARLQAGLERLRLAGSEAQIAQAEAAANQARLAAQRRANAQELADIGSVLQLYEAKGDAETNAEAKALKLRRDVLVEAQKGLAAEAGGVALAERRAVALAQVAQLEATIRDVGQVTQAQAERTLATLRSQFAGEADLIRARRDQQQAALDAEAQGLRTRQTELEQAGALSQAERERLDRALEVVAAKRDILNLDTQTALTVQAVSRALAEQAALGRLQDTLLQGQLDRWEARGEQDAIHVRLLGLTSEHEQQILTLIQSEVKARQTQLELDRVRQKSAEVAAEFATTLQTTAQDQMAEVTAAYAEQQTALDHQARKLLEILQTLGLINREAAQAPGLARAREFAQSLAEAVTSFQQSLTQGTLDVATFVRGIGQSFIDYAMKPLFNQMQESLTRLLQSISGKLGGWGDVLMAGVGVALTAASTLFHQQKAEVEALGDQAKSSLESVQNQRGLLAGQTSIALQQISDDLARALRPTNEILLRSERILAQIATALGSPATANATAGTAGYSISVETLGASRV